MQTYLYDKEGSLIVINAFYLIVDFILPITMICLGFYYKKLANKDISETSGFRTTYSMSSQNNWQKAHLMASKLLIVWGVALVGYAIIIRLFHILPQEWMSLINNLFYMAVYIGITIHVNRYLS